MAGTAVKDKTVVVTGANRGLGLEARHATFLHTGSAGKPAGNL